MELVLKIEYADPDIARSVFESLEPDNKGYILSELERNILTFTMTADSAGTLRNTADDLLACVKVVEDTLGLVSASIPDLDGDALFE